MEMQHRRRSEDNLAAQIKKLALLVGAIGTIGAGMFWINDTKYVTKIEYQDCQNITTKQLSDNDKTIAVMQNDLKYIRDGIDEIKRNVK